MATIKYRDLGFGTNPDQIQLEANEYIILTDVGGALQVPPSHPGTNEKVLVFDHHFSRDISAFPSATAAVCAHASGLYHWIQALPKDSTLILATHSDPDFDALASRYLVESLTREAWNWEEWTLLLTKEKSYVKAFWLNPKGPAPWYLWFARYASAVDQCAPIRLAPEKRWHSVLYSFLRRREPTPEQVRRFMEDCRTVISDGANPFFDFLFSNSGSYLQEIAFLQEEEKAYRLDLKKARKAIVQVPGINKSQNIDGIFIRDPESILFKEFARSDNENSYFGKGFVFTMVAQSGGIEHPKGENDSRYWIALDPEHSHGLHLRTVWKTLQGHEVSLLKEAYPDRRFEDHKPRPGYEHYEPGSPYWDDPWYDGAAFNHTIVDTPWRGTCLSPGKLPDLTDDTVAQHVSQIVEDIFFQGLWNVIDFYPFSAPEDQKRVGESSSILSEELALFHGPGDGFRFCSGIVKTLENINHGPLLERLKAFMRAQEVFVYPERLVLVNFRGIAIVTSHSDDGVLPQTERELGDLSRGMYNLSIVQERLRSDKPATWRSHELLRLCRDADETLTDFRLRGTLPGTNFLTTFLDMIGFGDTHSTISTSVQQINGMESEKRENRLQILLAWATGASLALSWMQVGDVLVQGVQESGWNWLLGFILAPALSVTLIIGLVFSFIARSKK